MDCYLRIINSMIQVIPKWTELCHTGVKEFGIERVCLPVDVERLDEDMVSTVPKMC